MWLSRVLAFPLCRTQQQPAPRSPAALLFIPSTLLLSPPHSAKVLKECGVKRGSAGGAHNTTPGSADGKPSGGGTHKLPENCRNSFSQALSICKDSPEDAPTNACCSGLQAAGKDCLRQVADSMPQNSQVAKGL